MRPPRLRKAVVTGGTGLVGRHLTRALLDHGARVAVVSRQPERAQLPPGAEAHGWQALPILLEGADAVFNLAGENLAAQRWSPDQKERLRHSRLESTRQVVSALQWVSQKPGVLVNASAVGIYGDAGMALVDEEAPMGAGFLPEVCQAWEEEAEAVALKGVRVVKARFGIVLSMDGGALPRMVEPVRRYVGSALGSGRQGLSWIHIQDLTALLLEAALNSHYAGPLNVTAPRPVSQKTFMRALATELHRPLWPVPGFITRLVATAWLGDMARPLLLEGVYAYPKKALTLGFRFAFEHPDAALRDLLGS